jgi:hypothetical protein
MVQQVEFRTEEARSRRPLLGWEALNDYQRVHHLLPHSISVPCPVFCHWMGMGKLYSNCSQGLFH